MEILDSLLESMDDGEWHDINELSTAERLRKVSITRLMLTLHFLGDYDLAELGEVWKGDPKRPVVEAKLSPYVQIFIRRIKWIERAEKK